MCVYPIQLLYRIALATMPYLCEVSTVLVLSACLSSLSTRVTSDRHQLVLKLFSSGISSVPFQFPRQTAVVKVTNPTPIQMILSVVCIVGMQSICGNVVRADATCASQMTAVSKPIRGTEIRHSKYLHDTANNSTCLIQVT
jgi:hypothetical protein